MQSSISTLCAMLSATLIDQHRHKEILWILQTSKMAIEVYDLDLVSTGANPETIDKDGNDPILSAAGNGHSEVINIIAGVAIVICTAWLTGTVLHIEYNIMIFRILIYSILKYYIHRFI